MFCCQVNLSLSAICAAPAGTSLNETTCERIVPDLTVHSGRFDFPNLSNQSKTQQLKD
jgi:hypothetical protein